MAKKPTLNNISANGFEAISTYNANQDAIGSAFDNTLSLDGSTPNQMEADLDLNSNKVINGAEPTADSDLSTKKYVDDIITTLTGLDPDTLQDIVADLADKLDKSNNLSDIASYIATRANLDVYSTSESDAATNAILDAAVSDVTVTVGAAGDYTDLQGAVDAIDTWDNFSPRVNVIQLLEPVDITEQILLRSSSPQPVRIDGAAWTAVTYTGISNSGSSGAHSITLTLTGRTWAIDDVIVISGTTGTGDHEVLQGCYQITGVAGSDVTFTHKGVGSWPTLTISTMTVSYVPSVIRATGTNILSSYHVDRAADPGVLEPISGNWIVRDIAIVDASTDADAHGAISAFYGGGLQLNRVGINGFKYSVRSVEPGTPIDTRYVYAHGAVQDGITAQVGAPVVISDCAVSGCGGVGIRANNGSHAYVVDTRSMMNGNGFVSNGTMTMSNCQSKLAVTYDLYATQNGDIYLSNFTGDGTARVAGGGRLFIDSGGLTVDTIALLEGSSIVGEANLTASTKTYTNGHVDGVKYPKNTGFTSGGVSSIVVANNTYVDVVCTETFDSGSVYTAGVFTATEEGMHDFNAGNYFDKTEGGGSNPFTLLISRFVVTGVSSGNYRFGGVDPASTASYDSRLTVGTRSFYLEVGDTVKVQIRQSSGETKTINRGAEFWWFNGHRVT